MSTSAVTTFPNAAETPARPIGERVREREMLLGRPIRRPAPPALAACWVRGQAEGIPLRELYVVADPLHPGSAGACDTHRGDVWLYVPDPEDRPADGADGDARLVRTLLHEIAHAARGPAPVFRSVAEDWAEERATWEHAFELADAWGLAATCDPAVRAALRDETDRLADWHELAAGLAGTADPGRARAAFTAIRAAWAAGGAPADDFEAALNGYADDPAARARVVCFDRTLLGGPWALSDLRTPPCDFGALAQAGGPEDDPDRAVAVLRDALQRLAHRAARAAGASGDASGDASAGSPTAPAPTRLLPSWRDAGPTELYVVDLDRDADWLGRAIAATQHALLRPGAAGAVGARWTCYGDVTGPRCYVLEAEAPHGPTRTVLVAGIDGKRRRTARDEAAFQRYLATWARIIPVTAAPFAEAAPRLWALATTADVRPGA